MSNNYPRNNRSSLTPEQSQQNINKIMKNLTSGEFIDRLSSLLPANVDPQKFARLAANAVYTHPQQDKLANCDQRTLFIACQRAATDGLTIDGRRAALVVFWNARKGLNDVSYIPMAEGLVDMARRSGEVSDIAAHVVYTTDKFIYRPGIDNRPMFEPKDWFDEGKRGEPKGAFATVTLLSGEVRTSILSKAKITSIANDSNNSKNYSPKSPHFEEWWKKAALRNVLKYSPKSAEMIEKMERADKQEFSQYDERPQPQLTNQSSLIEEDIPPINSFVDGNEFSQEAPEEDYSQVTWPVFDQEQQCFMDSTSQIFDHNQFAFNKQSFTPLVDGNGQFIKLPNDSEDPIVDAEWPINLGNDWVFADDTIFDPEKHAWSKANNKPSVTKYGLPVAKRGTAATQKAEQKKMEEDPCQGKTRAFEKIYNYIQAAVDQPSFEALDKLKEWAALDRGAGEGMALRLMIETKKTEIFGDEDGNQNV